MFGKGKSVAAKTVKTGSESSGEKTSAREFDSRGVPTYTAAWGWAASTARFRGTLVLILLGIVAMQSFGLGVLLLKQELTIVGIDSAGVPSLLVPTVARIDPEMFSERFLSYYANYSPTTIQINRAAALKMVTQTLGAAINEKLGKSFVDTVKRDKVAQTISIRDTKVEKMNENGFVAIIEATRYRTLNNVTTDIPVQYQLDIIRGPLTKDNPWGFYVSSVKETEKESGRN